MEGSKKRWGTRAAVGLLWAVTAFEALTMSGAGAAKFDSGGRWMVSFVGWGYPAAFTYVIGAAEVLFAIALLVPRVASYAAAVLGVIMIGALATVVIHDDPLGIAGPIIHLVALGIIGVARRNRRWRPTSGRA